MVYYIDFPVVLFIDLTIFHNMKRMIPLFLAVLFLILPRPALAWEGKVVRVSDGDTITVERAAPNGGAEQIRIRLYGIDTPESKGGQWGPQPHWKAARAFLADLFGPSGKVAVVDMGYDKYSRTIGSVITLPDGKIVQEELIKAGLAWVYTKYCRDCRQWKTLEDEAREARRGLWREICPIPPWEWRKGRTE